MGTISLIQLFTVLWKEFCKYLSNGKKAVQESQFMSFLYTLFVINNLQPDVKVFHGYDICDYKLLKTLKALVMPRVVKFGVGDNFKNVVKFVDVNPKTAAINIIKARISEINASLNEEIFGFTEDNGFFNVTGDVDGDHKDIKAELAKETKKLGLWNNVKFLSPNEFRDVQRSILMTLKSNARVIPDDLFDTVVSDKGPGVVSITEAIKCVLSDGYVYVDSSMAEFTTLPVNLNVNITDVIEDYAINIPDSTYFAKFAEKLWANVVSGSVN